MISSFDFSIVWDDNPTCAEAGHYRKMQAQKELVNAITMVPNSASETATVYFNNSFDKNIALIITDYLGRKVASYLLTLGHKQITIDVHNLPPGVYVVQSNEDKSLSTKFIVIK